LFSVFLPGINIYATVVTRCSTVIDLVYLQTNVMAAFSTRGRAPLGKSATSTSVLAGSETAVVEAQELDPELTVQTMAVLAIEPRLLPARRVNVVVAVTGLSR
jgi:hypothetical protein